MQIMITHGGLSRTRVLSFSRLQIMLALGTLLWNVRFRSVS
jgi:hypothetical protein